MSKAAQEMQRLADELKKQRTSKPAAGRRRRDMAEQDDELGIEPEQEAPAAAPAEQPAQGEAEPAAAAVTEEGAGDMAKKKPAAPRTRAKSTAKAPAAKPRAAAAPKAARTPKAPAPAPAARPAKVRDPLAGIREKPKLQGVLLGAAVSRAVVARALKCLQAAAKAGDEKLDDAETREVARLLARIEARG